MKIDELMNRYYDTLKENDRYICSCIIQHTEDCIHLSIDQFADKYQLSSSTLSRFAQKLSLPGYSELRAILRLDQEDKHTITQSVDSVAKVYHQCIEDMEKKDCTLMFERMLKAERIIIFGEGYAQERVAKEMKRIFLPTEKKLLDMSGNDMIPYLLNFIQPTDMVFIISLKGEAKEIIEFTKKLILRDIYCVSITHMKSNMLSHLCQENLYIRPTALRVSDELTCDITTPYFILIELLYIKYTLATQSVNILP